MIDYLLVAEDLARQAGKIMHHYFQRNIQKNWKEDHTPVTTADLEINDLVIRIINKHFPTHSILGEENSQLHPDQPFTWVCDPIDGTIPYSHHVPTACFSLALVENGQSILGVLYDPFQNLLYSAQRGHGATMNGQPIHVSPATELDQSIINVEHWQRALYQIDRLIPILEQQNAFACKLNSTSYATTLVTRGEFLGSIYPGKHPWDAAAAKIIVEEAGGKVTDLYGKEQRYDQPIRGMLASNGIVHEELLSMLKPYLPLE